MRAAGLCGALAGRSLSLRGPASIFGASRTRPNKRPLTGRAFHAIAIAFPWQAAAAGQGAQTKGGVRPAGAQKPLAVTFPF